MQNQAEKIRENKLRRMAQRQGYLLRKSRSRDPWALGYGRYWVVEPSRNIPVGGSFHPGWAQWDMDDVEGWLTSGESK